MVSGDSRAKTRDDVDAQVQSDVRLQGIFLASELALLLL
jgi:hypothetical protein